MSPLNVQFILDGSLSITNPVFLQSIRPFVQNLTRRIGVSEAGNHVGCFQFARLQRVDIPMGSINEPGPVGTFMSRYIPFRPVP
jgi:hypothetical protein